MQSTRLNTPDNPLGIEHDLALLPSILAVQALPGLLMWINWEATWRVSGRASGREGVRVDRRGRHRAGPISVLLPAVEEQQSSVQADRVFRREPQHLVHFRLLIWIFSRGVGCGSIMDSSMGQWRIIVQAMALRAPIASTFYQTSLANHNNPVPSF